MANIVPFQFESSQIRLVTVRDEPWFVAKDILLALEYAVDGGVAKYINHVPDIWKGGKRISTPGGTQEMAALSEQGLYFFLGRSDKPKALPFQMWLAGDVVPSIRKTGQYRADWWKSRHASAASFKLMTDIVKLKREEQGKETKFYHFANEARLINFALTGQFTTLDREALSMDELNVLAMLEERNALMIAAELKYDIRKQALQEFMYRLSFVQRVNLPVSVMPEETRQ